MNIQREPIGIRILLWMLLFIPVLVLFGLLFTNYPGIPKLDDFEAIFQFLLNFSNQTDITEKWKELVSQNMEHRILSVHLFALAQFYLLGFVRLIDFVIAGNFLWLGTILLFFFRTHKIHEAYLLAPAFFLILQPQVQENSWWAMAALSNYSSLFFLGLSLWFITRINSPLNFSGGLMSAVFAGFCNGGGLVIWPTGLLVLLYRREYKMAAIWAGIAALTIIIYFTGYQSMSSGSNNGLEHPMEMLLLVIRVLGSFSEIPLTMKIPSLIPGLILLLVYVYLLFSGFLKRNTMLMAMLTALLMILGMLALSRFSASGLTVVPSRYKTFSLLFLALCYLALLERFPPYKIRYFVILFAAAGFWLLCSLIYYPKVFYQNRCAQLYAFNFHQTGTGLDYAKGDEILSSFIQKGWFQFPGNRLIKVFENYTKLTTVNSNAQLNNRTYIQEDTLAGYTTFYGNFYADPGAAPFIKNRYIYLKKPFASRLLEVNDARLRSWKDLAGLGLVTTDSFSLVMPAHIPDSGEYQIYYLTVLKDGSSTAVQGIYPQRFH